MPEYKPARLRRMAAFFVDIHSVLLLAFIFALLVMLALPAGALFFVPFCAISAIGYLYCRDWLLGGRSIGKRLCGLTVVDCATDGPAKGKQLLLKNLCYFIAPFDAIVLLLTGRSVGERISDTVVIPEKRPVPFVKKRLVIFIAIVAVLALLLSGIAALSMNKVRKNESYAPAYDYLTESDTFTSQEREDAHIWLTGFSASIVGDEQTHEYTFDTRIHYYTVTCHLQPDGTWAVCTDCTKFD